MQRYYFGLEGEHKVNDPGGLLYDSELLAFRAGQRLASDLSEARPTLRGNTCVIVTTTPDNGGYCVSIRDSDV